MESKSKLSVMHIGTMCELATKNKVMIMMRERWREPIIYTSVDLDVLMSQMKSVISGLGKICAINWVDEEYVWLYFRKNDGPMMYNDFRFVNFTPNELQLVTAAMPVISSESSSDDELQAGSNPGTLGAKN